MTCRTRFVFVAISMTALLALTVGSAGAAPHFAPEAQESGHNGCGQRCRPRLEEWHVNTYKDVRGITIYLPHGVQQLDPRSAFQNPLSLSHPIRFRTCLLLYHNKRHVIVQKWLQAFIQVVI